MSITAITFDFWQTLYKNRPVDQNARLNYLKTEIEKYSGQQFSMAQVKAAIGVARNTWNHIWATDYRTLTAHEWLTAMLAELRITLPPTDQSILENRMENSVLAEPPELVPEITTVLPQLVGRYQLGVISDTGITPGRVLRQILAADGLLDYFKHLTFSDELGRSKPHPDVFLYTLKNLHAQPAQAVHVGDLLRTDVLGAQQVGMRGVHYVGVTRTDRDDEKDSTVKPDAVISRHTELLALLEQWRSPA